MDIKILRQNQINAINILIIKLKKLIANYEGNFAFWAWRNEGSYCPIGTIFNTSRPMIAKNALANKSGCDLYRAGGAIDIFTSNYDKTFIGKEKGIVSALSDAAIEAIVNGIKALEKKRDALEHLNECSSAS